MKKLIVFFMLYSITVFPALCISTAQDQNNKDYLDQLDRNISGTIQVLSSFNEMLENLPEQIAGTDAFSQFLMELTLECSGIKKQIARSEALTAGEREELINLLILNLNPEVKWFPVLISEEEDEQNKQMIKIMLRRIIGHVLALQKEILREEEGILASGTFHKYFFSLHSRHFMFQLLLDFLEPSDDLSPKNRDFLIRMVRRIEAASLENEQE